MVERSASEPATDNGSILASPFARRLLILFVISALLPALLLGILTTRYLQHELDNVYARR